MEKVLVTGASGYIALHCITELLRNGYAVKGSLRSMNREHEVREAVKKEIPDNNLEFCKLDLMSDEGWDSCATECDYMIHCLLYTSPSPRDQRGAGMAAWG